MTNVDVAVELAAAIGHTLPAAYLEFLDGFSSRPTLGEGYGPILDFRGRHWRPYSRDSLTKPVRYNRGSTFPRVHETTAIAEDLLSGDEARRSEMTWALNERGFAVDRLGRGFCFGSDDNGEPLFIDPDTGGVFCYYHDGMDVEPWADSLVDMLTESLDWIVEDELDQTL